ncbi:ABC-type nitrate/sulfonate/bicarbonate transportsystem, periplasmic component [Halanaeroarchaeum sp. HSR-CO]|uniref:ABC transporter substrate-binding protein n=1 Tax=Halanaeroarchaeum sp. HSR-CO TaxID=2866382 RepID=UPI00217CD6CB|nr:ABC transporter substrate-binding protein [Halanaeroarchaeum sp. HSR-CO]UWG46809.1 ABC-type nitrate/sulfonate/bicarbonate transportsystem, periplasmic component [Halanaeroarchaeum sp. HSR-CO]
MEREDGSKCPSARDAPISEASASNHSRSRRAVLAAAGAGLTGALAGCIGESASGDPTTTDGSTTTQDDEPTTTTEADRPDITYRGRFDRVGLAPAVNDAGVETGTWREEGLDVSYETASGGQAAAKSVASGKDEFGNADVAAVLQLMEQDAPLTIIGNIAGPMDGIVSLEETEITSWTDLEGAVVGMYPFGSTGPAAKAAMREKDVDVDAVEFRNIQPGSGQKLLLDGSIDAVIRYFPQMVTRLDAQGESTNVLRTQDVLGHLGIMLYAHDDLVENHPDRVNGFVRGWLKAFQVWATDVDRVIELYEPLAVGEFDEELERQTLPALYASQAPSRDVGEEYGKGWIRTEDMTRTIDAFAKTELLSGDLDAESTYTMEFIEANRDLAIETAEALYGALEDYDVGPDYL